MLKVAVSFFNNTETKYLFHALVILEYGLRKSTFNYQLKILLLRIHYQLGAFLHPLEKYVPTLDIKQILLDSMSWVYIEGLDDLASGNYLKDSLFFYVKTLEIYARNEIECADMLILAYEKGTYSKIFEFLRFRNMLRCSIQQAISRRLIAKAEIRIQACSEDENSLPRYLAQYQQFEEKEECFDNRDKAVVVNWANSPETVCTRLARRETPNQNKSLREVFKIIPLFFKAAFDRTEEWNQLLLELDACESNDHRHIVNSVKLVGQALLEYDSGSYFPYLQVSATESYRLCWTC